MKKYILLLVLSLGAQTTMHAGGREQRARQRKKSAQVPALVMQRDGKDQSRSGSLLALKRKFAPDGDCVNECAGCFMTVIPFAVMGLIGFLNSQTYRNYWRPQYNPWL